MSNTVLNVEKRKGSHSKGELNRLRKQGKVPAILFGKQMESVPLFVDLVDFQKVYESQGKIFEISFDSQKHLINAKNFDKNAVGNVVLHIDFYKLKKGQKTTVSIPIQITGEAKGAKEGGVIQTVLGKIDLTAVPSKIPEALEVDISELQIGDSIRVKDLAVPADTVIEDDPESTIVGCYAPQAEEPQTPAEATSSTAEDDADVQTESQQKAPEQTDGDDSEKAD